MSLDQDVSSIEAVLNRVGLSLFEPRDREPVQERKKRSGVATTPSRPLDLGSRLAQGSAADLDVLSRDYRPSRDPHNGTSQESMKQDGYSAKRKRVSSPSDHEQQVHCILGNQKPHSRDLMPPPPVPHRQPFIQRARVHDPDLDEILDQTRRTAASQNSSPHSEHRGNDHRSNLTHQFNDPAAASHPPLVPTQTAANKPYVPVGQSPHTSSAAEPPRQSGWPLYSPQRYEREHRDPLSLHQVATTPRHSDQRHYQGLSQNNLQNPVDLFIEDRARLSNHRRIGTTGGLGLSSNARSSSSSSTRQPSQSPANASAHRQRLGEAPSASPHFPPRALPGSTSRSRFANRTMVGSPPSASPYICNRNHGEIQAPHFPSPRTVIQQPFLAGGTTRLPSSIGPQAPYPNGNSSAVRDGGDRLSRSRADAAGLQFSATRQPNQLRGRVPTTDLQALALRRRANR